MSECGRSIFRCICILPINHSGDHVCDCEGSWDDDNNVVLLPQVVTESGGIFPIGFRFFDDDSK